MHVAGWSAAVCQSDALPPFVARPLSPMCISGFTGHANLPCLSCQARHGSPCQTRHERLVRQLGCCSRAAPCFCCCASAMLLLYRYVEHDWLVCAGRPIYCHYSTGLHRDSPIPSSAARRENSARKSQDAMRACRKMPSRNSGNGCFGMVAAHIATFWRNHHHEYCLLSTTRPALAPAFAHYTTHPDHHHNHRRPLVARHLLITRL